MREGICRVVLQPRVTDLAKTPPFYPEGCAERGYLHCAGAMRVSFPVVCEVVENNTWFVVRLI